MNTKQIQHHIAYIKIAQNIGNLSYCKRKQVGSVIVKDNNIISTGYNGTPAGMPNVCENTEGETNWFTLHSESNAIAKLTKSTQSSDGSILYITLSPCKDCAKLILQSGITEIYYLVQHSCEEGLKFLTEQGVKCTHIAREVNNVFEEGGTNSNDFVLNVYEKFTCKQFQLAKSNDISYKTKSDNVYDSEWEIINTIPYTSIKDSFKKTMGDETTTYGPPEEVTNSDVSEALQSHLNNEEIILLQIPTFLPYNLLHSLHSKFKDKYNIIVKDHTENIPGATRLFHKPTIRSKRYFFRLLKELEDINNFIINYYNNEHHLSDSYLNDDRKNYPDSNNVYLSDEKLKKSINEAYGKIEQDTLIYIPNIFKGEFVDKLCNEFFNYKWRFINNTFHEKSFQDLFVEGVEGRYHFKNEYKEINDFIKNIFYNEPELVVDNYLYLDSDDNQKDYVSKIPNKLIVSNKDKKVIAAGIYGKIETGLDALDNIAKASSNFFGKLKENISKTDEIKPIVFIPKIFSEELEMQLLNRFGDKYEIEFLKISVYPLGKANEWKALFAKGDDGKFHFRLGMYKDINKFLFDLYENNNNTYDYTELHKSENRAPNHFDYHITYSPPIKLKPTSSDTLYLPMFNSELRNLLKEQYSNTFILSFTDELKLIEKQHEDDLFILDNDTYYFIDNEKYQFINKTIHDYIVDNNTDYYIILNPRPGIKRKQVTQFNWPKFDIPSLSIAPILMPSYFTTSTDNFPRPELFIANAGSLVRIKDNDNHLNIPVNTNITEEKPTVLKDSFGTEGKVGLPEKLFTDIFKDSLKMIFGDIFYYYKHGEDNAKIHYVKFIKHSHYDEKKQYYIIDTKYFGEHSKEREILKDIHKFLIKVFEQDVDYTFYDNTIKGKPTDMLSVNIIKQIIKQNKIGIPVELFSRKNRTNLKEVFGDIFCFHNGEPLYPVIKFIEYLSKTSNSNHYKFNDNFINYDNDLIKQIINFIAELVRNDEDYEFYNDGYKNIISKSINN